jgi:hypothetical protein
MLRTYHLLEFSPSAGSLARFPVPGPNRVAPGFPRYLRPGDFDPFLATPIAEGRIYISGTDAKKAVQGQYFDGVSRRFGRLGLVDTDFVTGGCVTGRVGCYRGPNSTISRRCVPLYMRPQTCVSTSTRRWLREAGLPLWSNSLSRGLRRCLVQDTMGASCRGQAADRMRRSCARAVGSVA